MMFKARNRVLGAQKRQSFAHLRPRRPPDYRIYSRMLASGTRRSSSSFDPYAILAASIAKAQITTENRGLTTSSSIVFSILSAL